MTVNQSSEHSMMTRVISMKSWITCCFKDSWVHFQSTLKRMFFFLLWSWSPNHFTFERWPQALSWNGDEALKMPLPAHDGMCPSSIPPGPALPPQSLAGGLRERQQSSRQGPGQEPRRPASRDQSAALLPKVWENLRLGQARYGGGVTLAAKQDVVFVCFFRPCSLSRPALSTELVDFKTRRVAAFRKNLVELAELELKHAKVLLKHLSWG